MYKQNVLCLPSSIRTGVVFALFHVATGVATEGTCAEGAMACDWDTQNDLQHLADLLKSVPQQEELRTNGTRAIRGIWLDDKTRYEVCPHPKNYGAWMVCLDWISSPCVVYSFGIGNLWMLDDALATHHDCEVHSFDPTNGYLAEHRAHDTPNVHFHYLGLSNGHENSTAAQWVDSRDSFGRVTGPCASLDKIMSQLGHSALDVLKVDCEGCEWESFAHLALMKPRVLDCVHVLLVEFHFARRHGGESKQMDAATFTKYMRERGWKIWFGYQEPWGLDGPEEEAKEWQDLGLLSMSYQVGWVNLGFDKNACARTSPMLGQQV